jgi:Peptidase family M28
MSSKLVVSAILFLLAFPLLLQSGNFARADTPYPHLTDKESQVISLVNGTSTYDYDLQLEKIALDENISGYSFRSAGSPGANQSASWIKNQFEALGLATQLESFEFTNWYMPSQPTLVIDLDGDSSTVNDQVPVKSFQAAHYSWPTPQEGIASKVVFLPLPENLTRLTLPTISPSTAPLHWNNVNLTGKIVVIGMEVNWNSQFFIRFADLVNKQSPLAIIYTYWYDWMNFTQPAYESMAGRSRWDQKLPIGWIDYQDGLWLRNAINDNTSAVVKIPAIIEDGVNYNVVAKLNGVTDPGKAIVICGHYDTVMDAGFCDNGAGTAGVIELARVFADAVQRGIYTPAQTLVFIGFTGEELGFVGSIEYFKEHESEIKNISAVINLDSIGQGTLQVSETLPDDHGVKIDDIALKAAEDLGVSVESVDAGGSDQETFRNPISVVNTMKTDWNIDPGLDNSVRVKSAIMLSSSPLFYSDYWSLGVAGLAHTAYDNSTSTATLDWVSADVLEAHVRVAALSVMRTLAALYDPFFFDVSVGFGIGAVVFVVIVLIERQKVWAFLKKAHEEIDSYMEPRETVYSLVLTAFLLFSSFAAHTRIGRTEATIQGVPTIVNEMLLGFPFEMLTLPVGSPTTGIQVTRPTILWVGLFLNIALFFLLAFGVTYMASRAWYTYKSRKTTAIGISSENGN